MAFSFKPSNANEISVVIGIENELAGYILQSETINESTVNLEIPDQKGRMAQVIAYDKTYNCNVTAIGPNTAPLSCGQTWSWKNPAGTSLSYIVNSVERASTYNDTAKWNIQATAYAHATYHDKTEDAL